MSTPYERLDKLIKAHTPSEVVFKVSNVTGESVYLEAVITKQREVKEVPEDKELQSALEKHIEEAWDADNGRYFTGATVEILWHTIKNTILSEYDEVSTRCAATKRKTEQFIREVKVDDKHLPSYLIQVFLRIRAPAYKTLPSAECEALFEQFESLRRTYGKRSR